MKDRNCHIKTVERAIEKTAEAIQVQKQAIAKLESRLERQRAELVKQTMLAKFDQIDVLRQEISDLIAKQQMQKDEQ